MMIVLCLLLVYIPIDACFSKQTTVLNRVPRICLDTICVVDIFMSFVTGYQDSTTKKVVMSSRHVALQEYELFKKSLSIQRYFFLCRHYIRTWFILDLISSFNADVLIIIFEKMSRNAWLLKIPSFVKIFRLATLLKYMERFREVYRFSLLFSYVFLI